MNNYTLNKDNIFKIESIKKTIKVKNLNVGNIIDTNFGNIKIHFFNILKNNIKDIDLNIFLNNISTLKISLKRFRFLFNNNTLGNYDAKKNKMVLYKSNYKKIINHELFHLATSIYDKNTDTLYSGFSQTTNNKDSIGDGINEGYTQYLSEKYFNVYEENSYKYLKKIAKILEMIVEPDTMHSFYFNADLLGLFNYLNKYLSDDEVYQFITKLDFLNEKLSCKYLSKNTKIYIEECLKYINKFLLKLGLKKYIVDSKKDKLLIDDVANSIIPILKEIPNKINSKNNIFDIHYSSLINEVYKDVLINYCTNEDNTYIYK